MVKKYGSRTYDLVMFSPEDLSQLKVHSASDYKDGYQRISTDYDVKKIAQGMSDLYSDDGHTFAFLNNFMMISKRKNGDMYVIDGQRKRKAAIQQGLSLLGIVITGLTLQEEIAAFIINNTNKAVSPNLYLDNLARISKPVGRYYRILDQEIPGWRDQGASIQRLPYMGLAEVIIDEEPRKTKNVVRDKIENLPKEALNYLRHVLAILKSVVDYEDGMLESVPNCWNHPEVLIASVRFIVLAHKRMGNSADTNREIVDFLINHVVKKKDVWSYAVGEAREVMARSHKGNTSSRTSNYIRGFMIDAWNRSHALNSMQIPHPRKSQILDAWKKVPHNTDMPYELDHQYMMRESGSKKSLAAVG